MKRLLVLACPVLIATTAATNLPPRPLSRITLFGISLRAKDIVSRENWGPETTCSIAYPLSPVSAPELFSYLGSTYDDRNFAAAPDAFLNLTSRRAIPILDSIDYNFYQDKGLDIIEPQLQNRTDFQAFSDEFTAAATTDARRRELLRRNPVYQRALERSRYELLDTADVTADMRLTRGLAGTLVGKLYNPFRGVPALRADARVEAALTRSVTNKVQASGLRFRVIRMHPQYVATIWSTLKKYENPRLTDRLPQSVFNDRLKEFLGSQHQAVIWGAAVFEGGFTTTYARHLKDTLLAVVNASLPRNPLTKDTIGLAKAKASIGKTLDSNLGTRTRSYWYVSLARTEKLELQLPDPSDKNPRPPCQE